MPGQESERLRNRSPPSAPSSHSQWLNPTSAARAPAYSPIGRRTRASPSTRTSASRHNDRESLERILAANRHPHGRALIVVEGLYSMDGDVADLPRLVERKEKYDAWLMVDEAHALGVLGAEGRGSAEHFGVAPDAVDIWMGTLSKTLAACGGYIAGKQRLIEYLRYTTPGFIYSVGLSPPDSAAALAALRIMQREPERVDQLRRRSAFFAEKIREHGL